MIERITPPVGDLVTLSDCKRDLRLLGIDDQDDLILSLIESASEYCDGRDGVFSRALLTQTWRVSLPRFPIKFGFPVVPAQSISAISYYDADNAQQTLAASSYRLVSSPDSATLEVEDGVSLPSTFTRDDAVRFDVVCGYGDHASDVPAPIRTAVRILVGHWYNNASVITGANQSNMYTVPHAFQAIADNYRARVIG